MARRMMSQIGQWSSRIFGVECETRRPVYFALRMDRQMVPRGKEFRQLFEAGKVYSFHVHCQERIHRSKLYELVQNKLSSVASTDCTLKEMSSFLPEVKESTIKGFLLKLNSGDPTTEKVVKELLLVEAVLICSYVQEGDEVWQQHLSQADDGSVMVSSRYCVTPVGPPEQHPSVLNIINNDVFYSLEEAYKVMVEVR